MSYKITVNNPDSAWAQRSDGSVKQAMQRQAELCAGIANAQIFRNNYGDQIADKIMQAAMAVRNGNFQSMHDLIVAAGKYTRVSGFTGAVACLQHYVSRYQAGVQCGEEAPF